MSGDMKRKLPRFVAERVAADLDELAAVPDEVLADAVASRCRCLLEITDGDPSIGTESDTPDRDLAARLCEGCPGRRECLEFELRTAGDQSVGVWGGLSEDDRRAVHAVWRARGSGRRDPGAHKDGTSEKGGQES
jgi:WhiB family transcriptional regulator, redox-sensing transcriptional regulator